MTQDIERLVLTTTEAATVLGVCDKTVRAYTFPKGDLRPIRFGRALRYSRAELERFVAARTAGLN